MKRFLLLALCAIFALNAEARTLYVDARRPNNKGNGLSAKKAKKTLQAAINVARKGDTIIVLPGSYAPIETKNGNIRIKSRSGASNTYIRAGSHLAAGAIAKLGTTVKKTVKSGGIAYYIYDYADSKGTKTSLSGFTVDGGGTQCSAGVSGGTVKSCVVKGVCSWRTVSRSKLVGCTLTENGGISLPYVGDLDLFFGIQRSTLDRCRIQNNLGADIRQDFHDAIANTGFSFSLSSSESSKLYNCLVADNKYISFKSCSLVNCTVVGNERVGMKSTKAFNTVFRGVAAAQLRKNSLKNCYKGNSPGFAGANYRLARGSPCIDKGRLTKAQKKLVGKKDLAGRKRIRGKFVDIGCYEY